jgi:O-antigen/teichoic acid export membrane protein
MQINSIANLVNLQSDKTIIGYFLNLASVTAYEIGQKISLFSRMIVGLTLSALVPAISELDAAGKTQSILKLYERGNKYIASFAFPILIFTFGFADLLINLWMGSGFEKSVFVARLLVLGVFVNMLTGVGVMIVRGIGKPSYETEYAVICLVANILLGVLLVQAYGFAGVVIATPISVILGSVYFIVKFHGLYKFSFFSLARRAYVKPFLISVSLTGILYLLNLLVIKNSQTGTRIEIFFLILANGVLYFPAFIWLLKKSGFWDEQDKIHLITTVDRYPILGKLVSYSIG